MVKFLLYILKLFILAISLWLSNHLLWQRYLGFKKSVAWVLTSFIALAAILGIVSMPGLQRTVTLTALNEKNEYAKEAGVYLEGIQVSGVNVGLPKLTSGEWTVAENRYCWYEPGDRRRADYQTDSITFQVECQNDTQLIFLENQWRGKVFVQIDDFQEVLDTYWAGGDRSQSVCVALPTPSASTIVHKGLASIFCFTLALVCSCLVSTMLMELGNKVAERWSNRLLKQKPFSKIASYEFLFEELVKRDFKKKYKRTILGMAWSILSPLLTLFVMKLVFTQFFGRNTPHYMTYLFCGNLIFSYFNESTSQGMSSLMGNASIFTKVNIPKYLFLLSKNIQTLINFGLTLCVFFVFCVLDGIVFTWKFVLLIYPVVCLVLFNVGVGLILSALFVFFRDIQYLWSVFTMLLMYMSAIFYTIEGYSHKIQCAFLLNPVYLFIRYFRKIVIEASIPTIWFHLLIMVDVVIVLGIGFWMYKKYNTRFLYYV